MADTPVLLEYVNRPTPLSRLAVVALVAGFAAVPGFLVVVPVLGCVILFYAPLAVIAGVVALVFGPLALREIRQSGGALRGRAHAVAGMAMGGALLVVVASVLALVLLAGRMSVSVGGGTTRSAAPATGPGPRPAPATPATAPTAPGV